jgi:Skp family chaperone for outer membrane proteins
MAGRLPWALMPAMLALALCFAPRVEAADEQPTAAFVAVLDVQQVLRDSMAAKALRAEIEKRQGEYQSELARQENALRSASEKLMAERDDIAPEEFVRRRQEIDQQVAELRRQSQARKRQLETTYNDGVDEVRRVMLEVVGQIAQVRGATLVLNKSSVVLGASEFDITAEVIVKLDAALPSVTAAKPN